MTKKAMREKYSKILNECCDNREGYKEDILNILKKYFSNEDIEKISVRRLVIKAIETNNLLNAEDRVDIVRYWTYYQKERRSTTLITEILTDLQ